MTGTLPLVTFFLATIIPVYQSKGTAPDLHATLVRHATQSQPCPVPSTFPAEAHLLLPLCCYKVF